MKETLVSHTESKEAGKSDNLTIAKLDNNKFSVTVSNEGNDWEDGSASIVIDEKAFKYMLQTLNENVDVSEITE